jgi:hypothetical protein
MCLLEAVELCGEMVCMLLVLLHLLHLGSHFLLQKWEEQKKKKTLKNTIIHTVCMYACMFNLCLFNPFTGGISTSEWVNRGVYDLPLIMPYG